MSIKTNELRLGNFVFDNENIPMQIAKLETEEYTDWNSGDAVNAILEKDGQYYESDIMNYIPITEKWLLDFGFEKLTDTSKGFKSNSYTYTKGFSFIVHLNNELLSVNFWQGNEKHYVHELQNLFFALTGVELSVS